MAGGRNTKPLALVKGHRTKAEKAVREKAEKELLTGTVLKESQEVKSNPIAHKEFMRIKKLLKAIKKDDDLSGNIINTHCMLHAECHAFAEMKEQLAWDIEELTIRFKAEEFDFATYMSQRGVLTGHLMACDKKIMEKRKMLFEIAKDNVLTIQSAMRSIPKKEQKKAESPMAAFLANKGR